LGNKLYHLGEGEQARFLKLAVNLMIGGTALLAAEALALGRRGGVDWAQMVEVVKSSAIGSPLMNYKAPLLAERDFSAPQFPARLMAKDLDLALAAAHEHEIPMPATSLARQFLGAMKATGRGDLDFFALVTLLEELAGLPANIEAPDSE
jgi:3-hydroxyisobutyrate dehydrogenase-like beta-hydroxyacid dehydrogenase